MNILHKAQFLKSAAQLSQLPNDNGIEIAFAGRSNAGKSTAINVLTGIKGLAKTSKTPGRTQLINLFAIDDLRRLVDLPGYGYAAVPQAVKERWQQTLSRYLQNRQCLRGLILLMDIRHPLTEFDQHIIQWASLAKLSIYILLTKADKLARGPSLQILRNVQKYLEENGYTDNCQLFSAIKGTGIEQARKYIFNWLK
jgi:GTP-binding protein